MFLKKQNKGKQEKWGKWENQTVIANCEAGSNPKNKRSGLASG
jgi:hypothetical protein